MRKAAMSESAAISESSYYCFYAQSCAENLITSFPFQNKTNKDKMLGNTLQYI